MSSLLLAHHALVAALPFVVPVLVLGGGLAFLALRDRRGRDGGSSRASSAGR